MLSLELGDESLATVSAVGSFTLRGGGSALSTPASTGIEPTHSDGGDDDAPHDPLGFGGSVESVGAMAQEMERLIILVEATETSLSHLKAQEVLLSEADEFELAQLSRMADELRTVRGQCAAEKQAMRADRVRRVAELHHAIAKETAEIGRLQQEQAEHDVALAAMASQFVLLEEQLELLDPVLAERREQALRRSSLAAAPAGSGALSQRRLSLRAGSRNGSRNGSRRGSRQGAVVSLGSTARSVESGTMPPQGDDADESVALGEGAGSVVVQSVLTDDALFTAMLSVPTTDDERVQAFMSGMAGGGRHDEGQPVASARQLRRLGEYLTPEELAAKAAGSPGPGADVGGLKLPPIRR